MDIRQRLRNKLETKKLNGIEKEMETIPEEIVFDIVADNLPSLNNAIRTCVLKNIALKPYSSRTFGHTNIPLTEIPGLKNLFQQACINHGLLGYFDWVNENSPSPNNMVIMNNIITITCGSITPNQELGVTNVDRMKINQSKVDFLRKISREKFDFLMSH